MKTLVRFTFAVALLAIGSPSQAQVPDHAGDFVATYGADRTSSFESPSARQCRHYGYDLSDTCGTLTGGPSGAPNQGG